MPQPLAEEQTAVGSYFIANYPPFSFWKPEHLGHARAALARPAPAGTPLGLYIHIPFCRKRCKFCYFRVYTDKNSREVEQYLAALARELELYRAEATAARPLKFAYFGGGTPSFLSEKQLYSLVERLKAFVSWDEAEEVTFECEPGTLTRGKIGAIRDVGVTRLSLGVENLSDAILEENGRAHHAAEVFRAYDWARGAGFDQVNIDLIAGMVGESWENWRDCIRQTIDLAPDSVTIYQMELPHNATYARALEQGVLVPPDWKLKRDWLEYAFSTMEAAGYGLSSAYTLVRKGTTRFVYRDAVWRGADMIGTGVASFSHVGGVHYQNHDGIVEYIAALEAGKLPLARGLPVTPHQLLIRETILQLKLGRLDLEYFQRKFGCSLLEEFGEVFAALRQEGLLEPDTGSIVLTRAGLLRVDGLLPRFFEAAHRGARYS